MFRNWKAIILVVALTTLVASQIFLVVAIRTEIISVGSVSEFSFDINKDADLVESKKKILLDSRGAVIEKEKLQQSLQNDVLNLKALKNIGKDNKDDINTQLELKIQEFDTNSQALSKAKQDVLENEKNATQEVIHFREKLISEIALIVAYCVQILLIWIFVRIFALLTHKNVTNEKIRLSLYLYSWFVGIMGTILMILVAFAGNLQAILASFGFVSAALVVALQDLVSSLFAWAIILFRRQYKRKDIISLELGNTSNIIGKVKEVGFIRTYLEEIEDKDGYDNEQYTGRVISFPNNLILKHPIINFTKNDILLWREIELVITFESSLETTQDILEKITHAWYLNAKKKFPDLNITHKPKIYFKIGNNGVRFNVFFATPIGKYRSELSKLSQSILSDFRKKDIVLAYNTIRSIRTEG